MAKWLSGGWELISGTETEEPERADADKMEVNRNFKEQNFPPWTKVTACLCVLPEHSWMGMIDSVLR